MQWKLDLAENLDLKDTLQKIWATIFYFKYISLLEILEKSRISKQKLGDRFSAKSSFHCSWKGEIVVKGPPTRKQ